MSEKRYDTSKDKEEILKGLEFFVSSENPNLINLREIKDLMDKLELKDKMPFIYDLINNLCSNREIRRKGGLTKDEFIKYLEEKMNAPESKEGIHTIYDVFTDTNNESLPMTNFCRTAREIGDNEKDQELKELLENADMTGKELTFDEFYDIMKNEEENNNKPKLRNFQKTNFYSIKNSRKVPNKEKESEKEPNNRYGYQIKKVEQTKNKQNYAQPEEKSTQKEKEPEDEKVEKKIVLQEIITTEKEIELPRKSARYKYQMKKNNEKNGDDGSTKQYSYEINRKVVTKKEEENNEPENNEDKGEGSDSKRYHRRYRASYRPEQKTETTISYNRYRRKV